MAEYRLKLRNGPILEPFDRATLKSMSQAGRLHAEDEISVVGQDDWRAIAGIPGLAFSLGTEAAITEFASEGETSSGTALHSYPSGSGKAGGNPIPLENLDPPRFLPIPATNAGESGSSRRTNLAGNANSGNQLSPSRAAVLVVVAILTVGFVAGGGSLRGIARTLGVREGTSGLRQSVKADCLAMDQMTFAGVCEFVSAMKPAFDLNLQNGTDTRRALEESWRDFSVWLPTFKNSAPPMTKDNFQQVLEGIQDARQVRKGY